MRTRRFSVASATRNIICEVLCVEWKMEVALQYKALRRTLEKLLCSKYSLWHVGRQITDLRRENLIERIAESPRRIYYALKPPLDYRVTEEARIKARVDIDTLDASYEVVKTIRNTGKRPIYYLGEMLRGSKGKTPEEVSFKAKMLEPERRPLKFVMYNDLKHVKQYMIFLPKPLKPGDTITYQITYNWDFLGNYIEYITCAETKKITYELYYKHIMDYEFDVREFEDNPLQFRSITDRGVLSKPRRTRSGLTHVKWVGPGPRPPARQRFLLKIPIPGLNY